MGDFINNPLRRMIFVYGEDKLLTIAQKLKYFNKSPFLIRMVPKRHLLDFNINIIHLGVRIFARHPGIYIDNKHFVSG